MSTPPQEADSRTVDLSREERWVVHHALVQRADTYLEDERTVPAWLVQVVESIEADDDTITVRQGQKLISLLRGDCVSIPDADQEAVDGALVELEAALV
ncbi:hypothetical protein ACFQMM_10555 [Saliphagus sp. GCM10025308]